LAGEGRSYKEGKSRKILTSSICDYARRRLASQST
jgi:hypothetical protein